MPYIIDETVHIDAPIGLVWDVLQDPALRPCWDARVRSAGALGPGPLGRGARIEVALELGPLPVRAVMEYVTWKPPFRSSVRTVGHDPLGTRTTGSWRLREAPEGGTEWTTRLAIVSRRPLVGRLVERALGRWFGQLTVESQRNLKHFVETYRVRLERRSGLTPARGVARIA